MKRNTEAHEKHKKKEAERLRNYRAAKKINDHEIAESSGQNQPVFVTPRSFGKAVKRARIQTTVTCTILSKKEKGCFEEICWGSWSAISRSNTYKEKNRPKG